MVDFIEQIIGGGGNSGGGLFGGIFGEAREALVGGCWGIIMSGGFFFAFFTSALILLFGVQGLPFDLQLSGLAFPFICIIGISAILSPFIGMLFGAQSGAYSSIRHMGCFVLYLGALIGGMVAVSIFL
ncbi:MAG: hypothetical protein ACFE0Q_01185 [Anaerolineae bacterium]